MNQRDTKELLKQLQVRVIQFIKEFDDVFLRLHSLRSSFSLIGIIMEHFEKASPSRSLVRIPNLPKGLSSDDVKKITKSFNEEIDAAEEVVLHKSKIILGLRALQHTPKAQGMMELALFISSVRGYKDLAGFYQHGNLGLEKAIESFKLIEPLHSGLPELEQEMERKKNEIRELLPVVIRKMQQNTRVYAGLTADIEQAQWLDREMALELIREVNKRFNVPPLALSYHNRISEVHLQIIFNIFKLRKISGRPEFEDIDKALEGIFEYFGYSSPNEVYNKIVVIIADAMRNVLDAAKEQLAPYLSSHRSNQIIIVVSQLSKDKHHVDILGQVSTNIRMYSKKRGGSVAIEYSPNESRLRFDLDIVFLLQIVNRSQGLEQLENTIIHELRHVLDKYSVSYRTVLEKIRVEGLARFSEVVMQPAYIKILGPRAQQWMFAAKPIETVNELQKAEKSKYELGFAMWLTILLYFLSKRGIHIDNLQDFKKSNLEAVLEQERQSLTWYLNHFSHMNVITFLNFYIKACEKLKLRPAISWTSIIAMIQ